MPSTIRLDAKTPAYMSEVETVCHIAAYHSMRHIDQP